MTEIDYEQAYNEAESRIEDLQDELAELREELREAQQFLGTRTSALEDIQRDAEQALR